MGLSPEAAHLLGRIKGNAEQALEATHGRGVAVQVLRELYLQEGGDYDVQTFLAGYPETPSRILEELSGTCESVPILAKLAENPRTPKTILQKLARHERAEVRCAVAQGRGISPQTALILCDDPDVTVRRLLAENPSITPRVQVALSNDPVPFVRASLLHLSKLDEEIQGALCDDCDVTVRAKALLAPKMSSECLLRWADGDEGLSQRILLMRNQLPEKVLESLLFSEDVEVRREAVGRKRLTADEMIGLSRGEDSVIREHIASSNEIPELVQLVLAKDGHDSVRCCLAGNACVCEAAVSALVELSSREVDLALVGNSAIALSALEPVRERLGGAFWSVVAMREQLATEDLKALVEEGDDSSLYVLWYRGMRLSGIGVEDLRRLAHHELPSIRELAARSQGLTIGLMSDLSQDASPAVRLALARNVEVLPSFLETLSEDGDRKVRGAARDCLKRVASTEAARAVLAEGGEVGASVEEREAAASPGEEVAEAADGDGSGGGRGGVLGRLRSMFRGK